MKINSQNITEQSADVNFDASSRLHPRTYGKYLEDFEEGRVFAHPRGMTMNSGLLHEFATTFLESNPLYLNEQYAKSLGHPSIPASPILIMNVILSLGVQNNSEKAYANLGYYDMHFLKPVYAGDTLRAYSAIAEKKERGEGQPGIITLNTIGLNQKNERVIQYSRKIMVPVRPAGYIPPAFSFSEMKIPAFEKSVDLNIPDNKPGDRIKDLTGADTWYDNYTAGDVFLSPNGRTITDEHYAWTYRVGNTHPLHFDRMYSLGQSGTMSGDPIVYGGLVFAWLLGLGSRDVSENALWDMGYTEGYHTQPAKSGDTIYVLHRVLSKEPLNAALNAGVIQFQAIGLKNIKPAKAVETYGADLFLKENDKKKMGKEKIGDKIFEIERKLMIMNRG